MYKSSDFLISKLLKNWTGQHHPPANARARMLWEAAHLSPAAPQFMPLIPGSQLYKHPALRSDDWSQSFFVWVNEHTFQSGLQARIT